MVAELADQDHLPATHGLRAQRALVGSPDRFVFQQPASLLARFLEGLPVLRVVLHPPVVGGPIHARCCASEVYTSHSAELLDDLLARTWQMSHDEWRVSFT